MRYPLRFIASSIILITGCSVATQPAKSPVSEPVGATAGNSFLKGLVHGGQQPIQTSFVYLYAASTSGYGGASVSLLNSNAGNVDGNGNYYVVTNANGQFTIAADAYSCTMGQQVYLYSVGGNASFGSNTGIGLMAVLGQCGSDNSFPNLPAVVQMDEVTTIAAAYALAGFAADAVHVGSSSTNTTGLATAFATAANLGSLSTGLALKTTPAGNGSPAYEQVNMLANIIAACINSASSTSPGCTELFDNAEQGSAKPADTATAAMNIAHNPENNVTALAALATPTSPFQPTYTSADSPQDLTIGIEFTGGGLNTSAGIAIDGSGDIWVANSGNNSISEFNPLGAALSGSGFTGGGLDNPWGIAIDSSGNVWVANNSAPDFFSYISEFNYQGAPVSSTGYDGGGTYYPTGIAFDTSGDAWVSNYVNQTTPGRVSEFNYLGGPLSALGGDQGGGIGDGPAMCIAVDTSGYIWAAGTAPALAKFNGSGVAVSSSSGYPGGASTGSSPNCIAIDASGNVWSVGSEGLEETTPSGTLKNHGSCCLDGAGVGVAVDGLGYVWVATDEGIYEFTSGDTLVNATNSLYQGYEGGDGATGFSFGIAIDTSGNIWVTPYSEGTKFIGELVGAAAPVVEPTITALTNKTLGTRP